MPLVRPSLVALRLACDELASGRADVALSGGVCHCDDLFLHVGFSALTALSKSGQSRPFHRDADGLLPSEGAALFVLKRHEDAVADGDRIFGVIRAISIGNDGRRGGPLAPSGEGQVEVMREAYRLSGLTPSDIGYVECHATGYKAGRPNRASGDGRIV